jgi:hypothetical protein
MAFMIENMQTENITMKLPYIYERILHILSSNNSSIYQTKIECCNILSSLAKIKLNKNEFYEKILGCLKNACNDRVSKVQIAANQALKLWLDEGEDNTDTDKSKTPNNGTKLNKLNLLRNLSKMNKDKDKGTYTKTFSPDKIREEIYTKGIGSMIKTEKFLSNRANSALRTKFEIKKGNKEKEKMNKTCMSKSSDLFKSMKRENKNKLRSSGDDRDNNIKIYFKEKKALALEGMKKDKVEVQDEKFEENINISISKDDDTVKKPNKDKSHNQSNFSKNSMKNNNKSGIQSAKNRSMDKVALEPGNEHQDEGDELQVQDISEIKKVESMINDNQQDDQQEANNESLLQDKDIADQGEEQTLQNENEIDRISNMEELDMDNDKIINNSAACSKNAKSKILANDDSQCEEMTDKEKISNKNYQYKSQENKITSKASESNKTKVEKKESIKSSHIESNNKLDIKSPFFVEEENIADQMMVPEDEFADNIQHDNEENYNYEANQINENQEIKNLDEFAERIEDDNPQQDYENQQIKNGREDEIEEKEEEVEKPIIKKKTSPKKKKVIPKKTNKIKSPVKQENDEMENQNIEITEEIKIKPSIKQNKKKSLISKIPEEENNIIPDEDEIKQNNAIRSIKNKKPIPKIKVDVKDEKEDLQIPKDYTERIKSSFSTDLSIVNEIKFSLFSKKKIFKFNKIEFISLERNFEDLIDNFQIEMEEKLSLFNHKINNLNKVIQKTPSLIQPKFPSPPKLEIKNTGISTNAINLNDSFLNLSRISERQENDLTEMDVTKTERTLTDTKLYKSNLNLENLAESKILQKELQNQMITSRSMNEAFLTPIISQWQNILRDLENGSINKAFEDCLNLGDDILLLRLIFLTGTVLDSLENITARKTLLRLVQIWKCGMIQKTIFNLIQQSVGINLFDNLNLEEKNEILDVLYEFSSLDKDSLLSKNSLYLYNSIIK